MNDSPKAKRSKVYFASDFHLGVPNEKASREREARIVRWLDSIKDTAAEVYLLGDIFDFWFEYRKVVPKGFVRFLGKLGELSDSGIGVHLFCGNHDLWQKDYFEKEIGVMLHRSCCTVEMNGRVFMLGHGDGLDKRDKKYKILNKIFTNHLCIGLFSLIHPDCAMSLGSKWSRQSRHSHSESDKIHLGETEPIYQFCIRELERRKVDFFIFGHRHLSCDMPLGNTPSRYINTGHWETDSPFAEWDGENLVLKNFE